MKCTLECTAYELAVLAATLDAELAGSDRAEKAVDKAIYLLELCSAVDTYPHRDMIREQMPD